MTDRILDPVVEPSPSAACLAPLLDTLDGKRVGLWSNRMRNTTELLDEVEVLPYQKFQVKSTVRGYYSASNVMRPEEWGDIDGCDAVILTHGD